LHRPFGLLAKLKQPIEFDSVDGQAVDVVFVFLLTAAAENGQLGALALVAGRSDRKGSSIDCVAPKMHPNCIR